MRTDSASRLGCQKGQGRDSRVTCQRPGMTDQKKKNDVSDNRVIHRFQKRTTPANFDSKRPSTGKLWKSNIRSTSEVRPGTAEHKNTFFDRATSLKTRRLARPHPRDGSGTTCLRTEKRYNVPNPTDDSLFDRARIVVCIRKRPLNKSETQNNESDVLSVVDRNTLIVDEPKLKVDLTKYVKSHMFKFDYIFDEVCSNEKVYNITAKPLIESVFEGGMSTCFAYGQTGSGKTYTMAGSSTAEGDHDSEGMYARTARDFFVMLHRNENKSRGFIVTVSFYEIYGEKLFDLLANRFPLRVYEDTNQEVNVIGLTEWEVKSSSEVKRLIREGNLARTSGRTNRNLTSSRSHAVFQIRLMLNKKVYGKFSLIDLAGNEKRGTYSALQSKLEGAEINKSLLALKECIRALVLKKNYLPFRASKLTQVLRDSFVGENVRTCMIAMTSPGSKSTQNTLNTLRYAHRVKDIWKRPGSQSSSSAAGSEEGSSPARIGDVASSPAFEGVPRTASPRFAEEFARYITNGQVWSNRESELYSTYMNGTKSSITLIKEVLLERILHTENLLSLVDDAIVAAK